MLLTNQHLRFPDVRVVWSGLLKEMHFRPKISKLCALVPQGALANSQGLWQDILNLEGNTACLRHCKSDRSKLAHRVTLECATFLWMTSSLCKARLLVVAVIKSNWKVMRESKWGWWDQIWLEGLRSCEVVSDPFSKCTLHYWLWGSKDGTWNAWFLWPAGTVLSFGSETKCRDITGQTFPPWFWCGLAANSDRHTWHPWHLGTFSGNCLSRWSQHPAPSSFWHPTPRRFYVAECLQWENPPWADVLSIPEGGFPAGSSSTASCDLSAMQGASLPLSNKVWSGSEGSSCLMLYLKPGENDCSFHRLHLYSLESSLLPSSQSSSINIFFLKSSLFSSL